MHLKISTIPGKVPELLRGGVRHLSVSLDDLEISKSLVGISIVMHQETVPKATITLNLNEVSFEGKLLADLVALIEADSEED